MSPHALAVLAIQRLRPGAQFVLTDLPEGPQLRWDDQVQTEPTPEEIAAQVVLLRAEREGV